MDLGHWPKMGSVSNDRVVFNSSSDLEHNIDPVSRRSSSSRSSSAHSVETSGPPRTIILGLWPRARKEQVAYYTEGYETLYPRSKISLLYHSEKKSAQDIDEIISTILGNFEKRSIDSGQDVLIHLFGDDAATNVCRLLRAYRARTDETLGVRTIILDSVPIVVAPSLQCIRDSPQQAFQFLYLVILSIVSRLMSILVVWFSEPYNERVREDLQDPRLLHVDAKRCYIFPDKGLMFAWEAPREREGEEVCERKEFEIQRAGLDARERWSAEQERYWTGVEEAWEKR